MRSKRATRLAWIALGCLLAFLVLEGLVRLAFPVAKESDKFWQPDLVILTFCSITDVMDNSPQLEVRDLGECKQFFVLKDGRLEPQAVTFAAPATTQSATTLRDVLKAIANRSRVARGWRARGA